MQIFDDILGICRTETNSSKYVYSRTALFNSKAKVYLGSIEEDIIEFINNRETTKQSTEEILFAISLKRNEFHSIIFDKLNSLVRNSLNGMESETSLTYLDILIENSDILFEIDRKVQEIQCISSFEQPSFQ